MVVGIAVCELHIPGAQSLKEKRKVVRSVIDRVHARFRVSVAETDLHDLHQRAEVGVAMVCRDGADAHRLLDAVRGLFDEAPGAFTVRWDPEILEAQS